MLVTLERMESTDEGTFGRLIAPTITLFTGELPWRENDKSLSCIPIGIYQCKWTYSPKFKRFMYEVLNVPKRTGVRKHSANFMGDFEKGFKTQLHGCIALGEKIGWIDKQKALLLSAPAVRRFTVAMDYQPFTLEIKNA